MTFIEKDCDENFFLLWEIRRPHSLRVRKAREHEMIPEGYKSEEGGCSKDRRLSKRYPIVGVAWFQWKESDGRRCTGSGVTRNIGKAGIFIECESLPPKAATLKLDVELPVNRSGSATLRLRGTGDVRHVQSALSAPGGYGAAVILHMETSATEEAQEEK